MGVSRRRHVWVCRSPEGKVRIYAHQVSLEEELPGKARFKKRSVNPSGTIWEYGEKKKFVAERLPIRDSNNLPI